MNLSFFVEGVPVTQGSKRIGFRGKRSVVLDDNDKKLKTWRSCIGWKARIAHRGAPTSKPVHVELLFWMPKPKKPVHDYPRHDVDKLIRACLDALTAILWGDDSQVVKVTATKAYAPTTPGVQIDITEVM